MTISQTIEIPADHRSITLEVPREIPSGRTIISFTPAPEHPCPICARNIDPETGNPRYNAETIAAIKEGDAILRGEIPAKRYKSLKEMLVDLESDD
ncbi:MAG: hypothetical protein FWC01_07705 [Treponema sp.]|nr:hypothetical protein [Treponema sp.]MCL2237783.1 hypothetical protein [Treponema sp.]